jgi:transposase
MKAELKLKTCQVALDGAPDEIADLIRRVEMEIVVVASQSPEAELNKAIKISGTTTIAQSKAKVRTNKGIPIHRNRKPFPEDELIKLHDAGKSVNEIAGALKYSTKTVYNKLSKLNKDGRPKKRVIAKAAKAKTSVKPWSSEELTWLKNLAENDECLKVMAKNIKRPAIEVRAKLQELANKGIIKNTITALLENVTA